jgi:predicted RNA binding protein YcfA (HicA-like mRNA interferase family)
VSFQRRKVLQALVRHGVVVLREGAGHTILRGAEGRWTSVGRHSQLNRVTVRKMIKQLGLDPDELMKEMR